MDYIIFLLNEFLIRHHLLSIFLLISGVCGGAVIAFFMETELSWLVVRKMKREGLTRFPKRPIRYLFNRK